MIRSSHLLPGPGLVSLALFLLLPAASVQAVGPPTVVYRAADAVTEAGGERMVLLTLEADAGGIRMVSAHVAEGRPKTRHRPSASPGYLYTVLDPDGRPLLAGQFEVPWVLHGDEIDETTGELRNISIRLERVAFGLKVPLLAGADRVAFHQIEEGGPSAPHAVAAGVRASGAGLRPAGEIDLGPILEAADAE